MLKQTSVSCLAVVLCAGLALPAAGQSLTTGFAGPVEFLDQRNVGMLFDVTALHPQGITIQGFDVHSHADAGEPVTIEVYYGGAGFGMGARDPFQWGVLGRIDTQAGGHGMPTAVPAGGLYLEQGQRVAIYINHVTGGVRYHTEAATVPVVSNTDARIEVGAVQDLLLGGTITSPRGWMGTLHYGVGNISTMGACCMPAGHCTMASIVGCEQFDGGFSGVMINCSGRLSCPQPSACCVPAELGGCLELQTRHCEALDGSSTGWWCSSMWCGNVLHGRAWLINEIGSGSGGAHVSRASGRNNIIGMEASISAGGPHHRLADSFSVWDTSGWHVQSVVLYGIITAPAGAPYGQPPASPLTGAHVNIWDGPPGAAGSSVIATGVQVLDTGWTGVYRAENNAAPEEAGSPIMYVRVDLGDVHLGRGMYWVDYQLEGSHGGAIEVVTPPAMFMMQYPPVDVHGQARQLTAGGWSALGASLPLVIEGETGAARCYANCDGSTTEPILSMDDFICYVNEFAAASSLPWRVQVEHYANCTGSTAPPVLTVDDFLCFINAFAQGCP